MIFKKIDNMRNVEAICHYYISLSIVIYKLKLNGFKYDASSLSWYAQQPDIRIGGLLLSLTSSPR